MCIIHCTKRKNPLCAQKTTRKELLEKQVADVLARVDIPQEFSEWAFEALKRDSQQETTDRNKILANLQRQYTACVQKIDNLIDMRAAQEIDIEEFARRKSELIKEKTRLNGLLNDTDQRVSKWLEKAEEMFAFATDAKNRFETGGLEVKANILADLGSNLLLKNGKFSVDVQKPVIFVEEVAPEVKMISERLEPLKSVENRRTLSEMYAQSPIILRR